MSHRNRVVTGKQQRFCEDDAKILISPSVDGQFRNFKRLVQGNVSYHWSLSVAVSFVWSVRDTPATKVNDFQMKTGTCCLSS